MPIKVLAILAIVILIACQPENQRAILFSERSDIGIDFENTLVYTEDFNPYLYRNFYNGGGVSCGDINNDGLIDIYFTGNQVDNKLYLNLGDWKFKDITLSAGVACSDVWCTGANMVDINGDGFLDIYVCKGGDPEGPKRHNELFINNGDLTFTEKAKAFGLDIKGLSIQSAFLDYDRDGDLDCYILNNSTKPVGGAYDLKSKSRNQRSVDGNKFMKNEGGYFKDVAKEAGIYNSDIGFGLGITISDFNLDAWPDIYISNDFFEKDYLYINQQNGKFKEVGEDYFDCLPMGAMGADASDLNNDLLPDLMVTEMLPHSLKRKKTKAVYESWNKYQVAVNQGYYHQFPRNTLQRNLDGQAFAEIGRLSGVDATDWSWSCLMQDFDNDGLKDIFITNGIYKDLLDRDYLKFVADKERVGKMIKEGGNVITNLIDSMPSQALSNHLFKNEGHLQFGDVTKGWGLGDPGFSNGCAYADLDNDGDLDLILNNVNRPCAVYENKVNELLAHNWISIELEMPGQNLSAIGSKVIIYSDSLRQMQELFPSRGYQSSVQPRLHFGLGISKSVLDSFMIIWPDGLKERFDNIEIDRNHKITYATGFNLGFDSGRRNPKSFKLDTIHEANQRSRFNQFNRDKLLHRMNPKTSPIVSKLPDRQDLYLIGGAKNASSFIAKINKEGFEVIQELDGTEVSQVNDAAYFDMDKDGDLDIYLACGGTAYSQVSPELNDLLFENRNGQFVNVSQRIDFGSRVISTSAIVVDDWDKDGFDDLLISENKANEPYGKRGSIFILDNVNGEKLSCRRIEQLKDLGMITDMAIIPNDNREPKKLFIIGEWMTPLVYSIMEEKLVDVSNEIGLKTGRGLWTDIYVEDFNRDGLKDVFLGNCGMNTGIDASHSILIKDIDKNGRLDQILCYKENDQYYPVLDKDDLAMSFPQINKKYLKYASYGEATMVDLFGGDNIDETTMMDLEETESKLFLNNSGRYTEVQLPMELQYSSIHTSLLYDIDSDNRMELILGGNNYGVKPQFGREDASRVWCLELPDDFSELWKASPSSLNIKGEIRSMAGFEDGIILSEASDRILRYSSK